MQYSLVCWYSKSPKHRDSRGGGMMNFKLIISMLVGSGLIFFMAQLVWVICFSLESIGFNLASGPITMIYVRDYFEFPPPSFNVFQRELYRQLLWCVSQWELPGLTSHRLRKAMLLSMRTHLQRESPYEILASEGQNQGECRTSGKNHEINEYVQYNQLSARTLAGILCRFYIQFLVIRIFNMPKLLRL
jgi:hypothetical protein